MKKSIIAIAIAAVTAAPMAANATVTTYAQVQAEITSSDDGTDSTISMGDNARGRVGMKGSEELGNGMTMIGKAEFKMDTADGDAGTATDTTDTDPKVDAQGISLQKREMMVGLKAGWGTFAMGRLKPAYKYAGGVKYDAFVATALEARGVTMSGKVGTGKAMGHNSFASDTVGVYLMGGKLSINYGVDEATAASSTDGNMGDLAIAYKHKMGKKNEIQVAHVTTGGDAAPTAEYSATKVAGKFGAIKFQVESIDDAGDKGTNLFVAYSMKAAGGNVVIQGGQSDFDTMTDATTDVTVGYIKKFTKKARWFAGVRSTDGDSEATVVTYGMRFDY